MLNDLLKNSPQFVAGVAFVVFGLIFCFLIFPLGGILVLAGLAFLILSLFKKKN